jgi:hypothetical protein
MRNKKVTPSLSQAFSGRIAFIRLISYHSLGSGPWSSRPSFGDSKFSKYLIKERDLSWGGRVGITSERNTLATDHYHAVCSLSPLGFSDSRAPFFAVNKLASTNNSSQSRFSSWSSSEGKARHMSLSTSSSYNCLSRGQHVEGCGNRFGRSFHLAPVLSTQRMP